MSIKVELDRLLEEGEKLGTVPMLLTTDDDGRPRCSAVALSWDGTVARARAGHRSVANAAARPLVSLLWPAPPGQRFALLVDGEVERTEPDPVPEPDPAADPAGADPARPRRQPKPGGYITIRTTSGTFHVVAGAH